MRIVQVGRSGCSSIANQARPPTSQRSENARDLVDLEDSTIAAAKDNVSRGVKGHVVSIVDPTGICDYILYQRREKEGEMDEHGDSKDQRSDL